MRKQSHGMVNVQPPPLRITMRPSWAHVARTQLPQHARDRHDRCMWIIMGSRFRMVTDTNATGVIYATAHDRTNLNDTSVTTHVSEPCASMRTECYMHKHALRIAMGVVVDARRTNTIATARARPPRPQHVIYNGAVVFARSRAQVHQTACVQPGTCVANRMGRRPVMHM